MILALTAALTLAVLYGPPRHLVYSFDMSTGAVQRSDDSKRDTGTITIDVVSVQADTGTVIKVSEQSRNRPNLQPATCVTYGIGLVICSPSENVTVEEMCLLRLSGRNFLNWSAIRKDRTWEYAESDGPARETNDYRIVGVSNGMVDIAFDRKLNVPGSDGFTSRTTGRLSYNDSHGVPAILSQETVTQPQRTGENAGTDELITLKLQSDSLARQPD